ncbi:hypothetical protein FACS1894120_0180 [Clostridia bacterium]|nr:hypothetical protein FACS1894120_0180 [Clostridia bacterium]
MAVALTVIFLLALSAGLYFRLLQFPHIDFETGFFKTDTPAALSAGFYAVAAALFVILLVYGVLQRRKATGCELSYRRHHVGERFAALTGVSAFLSGFALLIQLVFGFIFTPAPVHGGSDSGGFISFLSGDAANTILTALAIAAYAVVGFTLTVRRGTRPAAGGAMVLLALYFTAGAAAVFNKHLVIKEMSNPLILLLTDMCAVLFFFGMGRIFARAESGGTRVLTVAFGFTLTLLIACECAAFWMFMRNADSHTLSVITGETVIEGINPQIDIPTVPLLLQGVTVLLLTLLLGTRRRRLLSN